MHDWTFISLSLDWVSGDVVILLRNNRQEEVVARARNAKLVRIPRAHEWGPSVSINKIEGPIDEDGSSRIAIEMQSGDQLEIVAQSFELPDAA